MAMSPKSRGLAVAGEVASVLDAVRAAHGHILKVRAIMFDVEGVGTLRVDLPPTGPLRIELRRFLEDGMRVLSRHLDGLIDFARQQPDDEDES